MHSEFSYESNNKIMRTALPGSSTNWQEQPIEWGGLKRWNSEILSRGPFSWSFIAHWRLLDRSRRSRCWRWITFKWNTTCLQVNDNYKRLIRFFQQLIIDIIVMWFVRGTTVIGHKYITQNERQTLAIARNPAVRSIVYEASSRQIAALSEISADCRQSIKVHILIICRSLMIVFS